MSQESYFYSVLVLNYFATLTFFLTAFYIFYRLKKVLERAAMLTIICYCACALTRTIIISVALEYKDLQHLEDNEIFIFDLNSIYIAYLGIYYFAFEMREVYFHLTSGSIKEFEHKKKLNKIFLLVLSVINVLTLVLRDIIFLLNY